MNIFWSNKPQESERTSKPLRNLRINPLSVAKQHTELQACPHLAATGIINKQAWHPPVPWGLWSQDSKLQSWHLRKSLDRKVIFSKKKNIPWQYGYGKSDRMFLTPRAKCELFTTVTYRGSQWDCLYVQQHIWNQNHWRFAAISDLFDLYAQKEKINVECIF